VGIGVAYWGTAMVRALSPASLPRVDEIRVDARALALVCCAIGITTILFGLVPSLHASHPGARVGLAGDGRSAGAKGRHRVRALLIGVEVALAVVLLVSAGLLLRSFTSLLTMDRGYRTDHVLGATLFFWSTERTPAARRAFVERLVDRASTLPGVVAAGATSSPPLAAAIGLEHGPYRIPERATTSGQEPSAHLTALTPGAFAALRMSLRRGRAFTTRDDTGSIPVAIVNEAMASRVARRGSGREAPHPRLLWRADRASDRRRRGRYAAGRARCAADADRLSAPRAESEWRDVAGTAERE
jgi:hypothetical protein